MELTHELGKHVAKIAREAGNVILEVRAHGFIPESKEDNTPVTEADKAADRLITKQLQLLDPALPIISEEGGYMPEVATLPARFWLVDPLDGTNGFIRGGKNFTVNIALIENKKPVFGVIYAPALEEMYIGAKTFGAYRIKDGKEETIRMRSSAKDPTVLISSNYAVNEKEVMNGCFPNAELRALSSSIKFCRVAEGSADLYVRSGPTSEWDTAAGQAILEAAGGQVRTYPAGEAFSYAKPRYLNPGVIAGDPALIDAVLAETHKKALSASGRL